MSLIRGISLFSDKFFGRTIKEFNSMLLLFNFFIKVLTPVFNIILVTYRYRRTIYLTNDPGKY